MIDANTQALKAHEIKEVAQEVAAEKLERRVGDLAKEMMRDVGEWQEALIEVLNGSESEKALKLFTQGDTEKGAKELALMASGYIYEQAMKMAEK